MLLWLSQAEKETCCCMNSGHKSFSNTKLLMDHLHQEYYNQVSWVSTKYHLCFFFHPTVQTSVKDPLNVSQETEFSVSRFIMVRRSNLSKRSKTVGCAASIGNNVHAWFVGILIYSNHKHGCISRRSRDYHLFGAALSEHKQTTDSEFLESSNKVNSSGRQGFYWKILHGQQ